MGLPLRVRNLSRPDSSGGGEPAPGRDRARDLGVFLIYLPV
jgi:hypothetical protein